MRTIQTHDRFPLSSVKPLEGLLGYREYCLKATRAALKEQSRHREISPVSGDRLEPLGDLEGLPYGRCAASGSLFLTLLPSPEVWSKLLRDVNEYRHSPKAFHSTLAISRTDNVLIRKLDWIQETLRLQELNRPRVLEACSGPSALTHLLKESGLCSDLLPVDEMTLANRPGDSGKQDPVQAALLLESLDRVDDPVRLLEAVRARLSEGGLLFVTALVSSGFDLAVLGLKNLYLYPPDRANCFSLRGLRELLSRVGFQLLEVSTPGVLDVEIVRSHLNRDPALSVSGFEREILESDGPTQEAFQEFLQQQGLSSFARIVATKRLQVVRPPLAAATRKQK